MVHWKYSINLNRMFSLSLVTVTRGHRYKLLVPRANLEIRRRFFAVRAVNNWNSLSDDTVEAAALGTFKRLLHRDHGQRLYTYHWDSLVFVYELVVLFSCRPLIQPLSLIIRCYHCLASAQVLAGQRFCCLLLFTRLAADCEALAWLNLQPVNMMNTGRIW